MNRSLKVVTPSTVPLFTTSEAKDFLKVDTTADDTLIDNLVAAATESCQIYTNQYFLKTAVEQYSDTWAGIYTLYKSPVSVITHIKYYDSDLADRINAVHVNYSVGYGITSDTVPQGIQQAVLLTLGNWYENRQTVITGRTATELPLSSQYLLDQYKIQVC